MQHHYSRVTSPFRFILVRGINAALVFAVLAFGVMPLFAAEPTAQLGTVSGTVAVVHANGSAVQPAGTGTSLGPGDRISTVGKSSAIIELPGIGQIELGASTTIIVHELRTASDQSWTSPVLHQGGQFTRTFTQAGAFMYFCEPHPQMTAFIKVQP
jgi:plastocyanin